MGAGIIGWWAHEGTRFFYFLSSPLFLLPTLCFFLPPSFFYFPQPPPLPPPPGHFPFWGRDMGFRIGSRGGEGGVREREKKRSGKGVGRRGMGGGGFSWAAFFFPRKIGAFWSLAPTQNQKNKKIVFLVGFLGGLWIVDRL